MTTKARKFCISFPCPNLAVDGAYCVEHQPPRPLKVVDAFYLTTRWRRFRASYLSRHPLCEVCEKEGRGPVAAVMVDHTTEIKRGGALTSDDNAMAMCYKCHGVKTANSKLH